MQYYRINFNKSSLSTVQYKGSKGGLYVKDQCRYSFIPKLPTFILEATWRKNKTSTGLIKWRKYRIKSVKELRLFLGVQNQHQDRRLKNLPNLHPQSTQEILMFSFQFKIQIYLQKIKSLVEIIFFSGCLNCCQDESTS